jgi:hypothetical protein
MFRGIALGLLLALFVSLANSSTITATIFSIADFDSPEKLEQVAWCSIEDIARKGDHGVAYAATDSDNSCGKD